VPAPDPDSLSREVGAALAEDLGTGDASAALIPATTEVAAQVLCRQPAVLCGQPWFDTVFARLDPAVDIDWRHADGQRLAPAQLVCTLRGPARALLSGERTALNFLQLLSGTATLARRYREAVGEREVRLLDTRKTLPGLRLAQKYAVHCGGCDNHRLGLHDCIMLKENHQAAGVALEELVTRARAAHPQLPLIVEVESPAQLDRVAALDIDRALLDNFTLNELEHAARRHGATLELEASGNIDLDNVGAVADTGVHAISIGALTKRVEPIDFSMRFVDALVHPPPLPCEGVAKGEAPAGEGRGGGTI